MQILCLNANTTSSITTRVGDEMRRTLGDSAEVIDCTPSFGPSVIKTRLDLAVATHAVVDAAASHTNVDAIMLAVSFDTGRDALREALNIPVIGMSEASIALARLTGRRIGYVSIDKTITPLYKENLLHCHLQADLAGWHEIVAPAAYRQGSFTEADPLIVDACEALVEEDVDVVVLLGAVLAGAAYRIQGRCQLPLIDGGAAGALTARAMVDLGLPKTKSGSFSLRAGGGLNNVSASLVKLQPVVS